MKSDPHDFAMVAPEWLADLRTEAPAGTLERFRKRASLLKGARFVLESQIYGFWIVLDTFFKLVFKHVNVPVDAPNEEQASRYRRALENSKEG